MFLKTVAATTDRDPDEGFFSDGMFDGMFDGMVGWNVRLKTVAATTNRDPDEGEIAESAVPDPVTGKG